MGQIGKVPEMLGGYSFIENAEFTALTTKDNFDGGGQECNGHRQKRDIPSLDHIALAMSSHTSYLQVFLRMHNHVLKGDGPLSYEIRHFVAMMLSNSAVVTSINKAYLALLIDLSPPVSSTDLKFLRGLFDVLERFLNKIMAHQPWLITKQMIRDLVVSKSWCLNELVHAIVILSHFHSLSSFIYGTGIEEMECVGGKPSSAGCLIHEHEREPSLENEGKVPEQIRYLMDQMKSLSESECEWEDDPEERNKRFASVIESEETNPSGPPTPAPQQQANNKKPPLPIAARQVVKKGSDALALFTVDRDFVYQDFVGRNQPAVCPTLRIQDCSWEDQGFSLLSRLYSDVSSVYLDDKHRTAYNLTYNTLSTIRNVDTSKFRRAVWNYILCLYGIRHDDYNYQEVNQLLSRELKTFIKRACCCPERLSGDDLRYAMAELQYSEKVHVLLMVMEARMEAELLYALRAVMQHLT
ncbi:unnamed protein product [Notodromas monacha]|uniref:Sestrin-1 n=1 Tax=Notodromas monacha TaxID=399045 RepID=A0A7R9BK07_9CRUS|nr:unnamed protein product [Notodromas monacha]CAG0916073.1 unnamed protein product [Notodromas monacha]